MPNGRISALVGSTSAPPGDGGNASVAKTTETNTRIVFPMVFPPDDRDVGSLKVPPSERRRNQKRRASSRRLVPERARRRLPASERVLAGGVDLLEGGHFSVGHHELEQGVGELLDPEPPGPPRDQGLEGLARERQTENPGLLEEDFELRAGRRLV